ncbi:MAG: FAD-dependent oxidoreductase [Oscillospiraceae bacterium]|nr:FAD-dependent oxidoreductase [Oscillospiraceae bacterium]
MKSRNIALNDEFDVIVAGGGPAGCAAAIASAREGAKTLLIEAAGALGGMGTLGLVPAWCPFSDKEKIIYGGLAQKIFEKSKAPRHIDKNAMDWQPIDPELLKRIYDDEVLSSGAEILFNTMLCGVEKSRGSAGVADAVIVSNKAGLSAYRAKIFIDCTGDGDLAVWAGAEFESGDETGDVQPSSHCFIISNVDEYGYRFGGNLHGSNRKSPIYAIINDGKYPNINSSHLCSSIIGPGTVGFNAGHIWGVDNTDPFSVTAGLIKGRKTAADYRDSLAEYFPEAFGGSFLAATGPLMGIRESRRITGDYILTVQDYTDRRSFSDEICRNSYYIDVHFNKSDEEKQHKGEMQIDQGARRYGKGESHGIPYRCLTPAGLKNVLVAGRSISCDRQVQGSVRVMPVCLCMGEAAGLAGALAVQSGNLDVHQVDTDKLRARLREEGAYLP